MTGEELEGSGDTPALRDPEDIGLLLHVEARVNDDRLGPLILLPPNVAGVVDEVETARQLGEHMDQICSRSKQ
jgi:hypothetical protein